MEDLILNDTMVEKIGKAGGWLPQPPDERDFPLSSLLAAPPPLPVKFELANQSEVRDQYSVSGCTGFATVYAVEYLRRNAAKNSRQTLYSPLFVYYHARQAIGETENDSGAYLRDAVKSLTKVGVARESDYKYYRPEKNFRTTPSPLSYKSAASWKLGGYYQCKNLLEVRTALAAGYPVVGGFLCFSNMDQAWNTGVIPLPSGWVVGGHAVMFMGYDDEKQLVKFKNSWGEGWGDNGYGYLPYQFFNTGLASDMWALKGEA